MSEIVVTYNEDYINNLLTTKAEENTYLEFKRAEALKKEDKCKSDISIDISAFANADGGILIYGIEEDNHIANKISFINGNEITKEWLENVISSNINRKIDGLIIEPIRFENDIKKTIYIVKIPRSSNAPHQASNKKYYKRKNFKNEILEEYEIRDLYNRKNNTQLEILEPIVHSKMHLIPENIEDNMNLRVKFHVDFYIKNIGKSVEQIFKTEFRFVFNSLDPIINQKINNYDRRVEDGYEIFLVPNSSPIFQDEKLMILTVYFQINFLKTLIDFTNQPINVKLYYTNGVTEKELFITDKVYKLQGNIR